MSSSWACLSCNTVGTGDPARHRCQPNPTPVASASRGYWAHRLRWALPGHSEAQIAALLDRPIDRAQLERWLNPDEVK